MTEEKIKLLDVQKKFVELDQLIELCLHDNHQNHEKINENFNEIKKLLDSKRDVSNDVNYQRCYYKYYTIHDAYLRAIGKANEVNKYYEASKTQKTLRKITSEKIHIHQKPDVPVSISRTAPYLSYLYEMVNLADTDSEKSDVYNKIAWFYHRKAQKELELHHLRSLSYWQYAKNNYEKSLKLNKNHFMSASGFSKCLVTLSKYESALQFLNKYENQKDKTRIKDYYLVNGIANRKQNKYDEAKIQLKEGLRLDPENDKINKELKLIERIQVNSCKNKIQRFLNCHTECKEENHALRQIKEIDKYRILSIDGGGIRGIIPAFWICEIEKRTHKPISHLFNLLAGTSTGGIISAGLSVPLNDDGFTPKYKAHDILDLYLTKSSNIFEKNGIFGVNLFNAKYADDGKLDLFKRYFENKTLSQALTELVIPAANEESLYTTYLFNRFDTKDDPFKNDTYVDALMATSAAPTFFPSYPIEGKGIFNDGGVHVNNPSSMACSEAIRYGIPKENLFVISMGTGTFVPDPLKQNSSRGLLFWASHLQDIALQAQVGNTDIAMYNALGQNYYRWQVWLDNPIALDDYADENLNVLMESANQFIEELDFCDTNSFNKLIEYLTGPI